MNGKKNGKRILAGILVLLLAVSEFSIAAAAEEAGTQQSTEQEVQGAGETEAEDAGETEVQEEETQNQEVSEEEIDLYCGEDGVCEECLRRAQEFTWADYEASLAAIPDSVSGDGISTYAMSDLSTEQQNIVRRAEEQAQVAWKPLKNVGAWNNMTTFTAGGTYYGIPYGQPVYDHYVPWTASLSDFSNAVNNISSAFYTERGSYGGSTFPSYSSDCSAFVSWAWGLGYRNTTSTLASHGRKLASDLNVLQVGDILLKPGSHVLLVEDVEYQNGQLVSLTTIEQTPPIILRTLWGGSSSKNLASFRNTYLENGYSIYRSNKVTVTNQNSSGASGGNIEDEITDGNPHVIYQAHQQSYGWMASVRDGEEAGITGMKKRMEALRIKLVNGGEDGSVQYRTHVQSYGWQTERSDWEIAGTEGEKKRMEAIEIWLEGAIAEEYDIYYRVHCETYGWLDWAKNGESAGTEGLKKRVEAIQIQLVKKGEAAPGETDTAYITGSGTAAAEPSVWYQTHVQTYGWQDASKDGTAAGTTGEKKRLEGIKIQLTNGEIGNSVTYKTHVQTYGWQEKVSDWEMAGTEGVKKRLEAITISLNGPIADQYDIYYRVHSQTYGWLGWAKNGEEAGTEGLKKRLEAIEIRLVEKGGQAPGSTANRFIKE